MAIAYPKKAAIQRGRPRTTVWRGKLGAFINAFTVARLAGELDLELSDIYRWARAQQTPGLRKAIAIVEVARASGAELTLEDIYESEVARVRARLHAGLGAGLGADTYLRSPRRGCRQKPISEDEADVRPA
jgi:hypothetical protein